MKRVTRDMSERGFALVGVVMFILVLTILGLSLFSLTGYEAQFMQQSTDNAESFQAAAGGLDRARFALAKMQYLENVKDNLPLDGVVYAVARRGADTTGKIDWDDPDKGSIMIRVKAVKNGQTHFLEASYDPSRAPSLYKRLMSLSGATGDSSSLAIWRQDPAETNDNNYWATRLIGEVRVNDDTNINHIFPLGFPEQSASPTLKLGGVPTPEVDGFFADHWTGAEEARETGHNVYDLDAISSPDSVKFFKTTRTGGDWSLDVQLSSPKWNDWDPQVTVHGTAVWLFDSGVRSEGTFHVSGSGHPNDMLVIVAKPSADAGMYDPNPSAGYDFNAHRSLKASAIALLGSINSTVPVILVGSGGVLLEQRDFGWPGTDPNADRDDKTTTRVNCLSVFAPFARVLGPDNDMGTNPGQNPDPSRPTMTLSRYDNDPANKRIDRLSDLGLLPNTASGLKGKLRFLAGTWREVDETTPP